MTDKQIIIDGVDVSGCENYIGANTKTHNCTLYDGYLRPCKNADCYYKQLKRKEQRIVELNKTIEAKEQECEELKKERDSWKYQWDKRYEMCECLSDQLDQLKAENDECIKDNEYLKTIIKDFAQEVVKLKQTLAEIKEIAEHCMKQDICTTCDNSDKCHIEDEEIPTYDVCKLILQEISECEVGNE